MANKFKDFATGKMVDMSKPEEEVRQEYEHILVESYNYSKEQIDIEVKIPRGSGYFPDKADIVIYEDENGRDPAQNIIGIVETKRPTRKDGISQIKSYMTATSAEWGVWTNKNDIAFLCREGSKILDNHLNDIPVKGQSLEDIGSLKKKDLQPFKRSQLKAAFRRILNRLYANTNISRREKLGNEMIKIIFSKLHDEQTYLERPPDFRVQLGETPKQVETRIGRLFEKVKNELKQDGIFSEGEKITLDEKSLVWVVGQLQHGSLLKTDSDVVGDAFEIFSEPHLVGEKGEFFTPRRIVEIAVKIADPSPRDDICDPACGSGGFLIYAMQHVWKKMEKSLEWKGSKNLESQKKRIADQCFFGIDKETDLVKIAKAHMAIAGDGRSTIVHENSLHSAVEFKGIAYQHFVENGEFRQFDIILTNPPFGTKTKIVKEDAAPFELGKQWVLKDSNWQPRNNFPVDRDPYILFVERCLQMLKSEGTLAIVLPESVLHLPSLAYLRQFIMDGNNIISIIDLPHNTFRPHCNAKTCLLVLRKREAQCNQIVMATPEEMGHDHAGRDLYRYGTTEIWDDLKEVLAELDNPEAETNKHVFVTDTLLPDMLHPQFYRGLANPIEMPSGFKSVYLGDLVDDGIIDAWDGHGSPESKEKGRGEIPYIRVSDIVNWEMYRNPVSGIPRNVYEKLTKNKQKPEAEDVVFVRRGSYRIGTVAMASPRDKDVLLTRELLTFRVMKKNNRYNITPYYLLTMLSSKLVQDQTKHLVFVDTTLPNIGDRWQYLQIPICMDKNKADKISDETKFCIQEKWSAQERLNNMRNSWGGKRGLGGLVT